MEIITTLLSIVLTILGWVLGIVFWFLSFLLMPLLIIAVIAAVALRYAWRTPITKPYVESMIKRLGDNGHKRARRMLYMITVEPFRVTFRFIGFSILHAWVNLWWKPKWSPWTRARQRPLKNNKAKNSNKKKTPA